MLPLSKMIDNLPHKHCTLLACLEAVVVMCEIQRSDYIRSPYCTAEDLGRVTDFLPLPLPPRLVTHPRSSARPLFSALNLAHTNYRPQAGLYFIILW